jgi:hypothetical protein
MYPCLNRGLPLDHLSLFEPQGQLPVSGPGRVRSVDDVPARDLAKVSPDGTVVRLERIRCPNERPRGRWRILARPAHAHDGAGADVLEEAVKEGFVLELFVVGFEQVLAVQS